MPKVPKYCHHKASGLAYFCLNRKRIYLGKHGSPESIREYQRLITRHCAGSGQTADKPDLVSTAGSLTVAEIIAAYRKHAESYYSKNGEPTSELGNIQRAVRVLRKRFAELPAEEMRPSHLKMVREEMVGMGWVRTQINAAVNRIRRMFRWAVAEEFVPPSLYHGLQALESLKRGRSEAAETSPVRPVPAEDIEATLGFLQPIVADMVRLQLLTGGRPGEIQLMTPGEIDRTGDVWIYRPMSHKTQHHGKQRILYIGPRAQEILAPYMLRDATAYCFQPCESERKRNLERKQSRQSPMTPSHRRRNAANDSTAGTRDHYDKNSYSRAVKRAAEKAGVPTWKPNQLRHTRATELRKLFGIDIAGTILGHSSLNVTEIYAEQDSEKAMEIMRKIG